ncbi:MAG TPA: hypothetical protein VGO62_01905, partial [Myxococcota bacterium]
MAMLAGCGVFPSIDVVVQLPAGVNASDVALHASVFAPAASAQIDCDKLAFGDVSADSLFASRVADAALTDTNGSIGDVPRVGEKLIVVDALDKSGAIVAAGCTSIDQVKAKTSVTVVLEKSASASFADPAALLVVSDVESAPTPSLVQASDGTAIPLVVKLTASDAQAVDGTVRLSLTDAKRAVTSSILVDVKAGSGTVDLTKLAVGHAGPFSLSARARFSSGPDPAPLAGLATFASPALDIT